MNLNEKQNIVEAIGSAIVSIKIKRHLIDDLNEKERKLIEEELALGVPYSVQLHDLRNRRARINSTIHELTRLYNELKSQL